MIKIFNFKFLPPGRGLWMMGTDFVKTRGGMALNNCAFASTEDIDTKGSLAFVWSMDALMLGVGVGFDTRGAEKIEIKQPDFEYLLPTDLDNACTILINGKKYILLS